MGLIAGLHLGGRASLEEVLSGGVAWRATSPTLALPSLHFLSSIPWAALLHQAALPWNMD